MRLDIPSVGLQYFQTLPSWNILQSVGLGNRLKEQSQENLIEELRQENIENLMLMSTYDHLSKAKDRKIESMRTEIELLKKRNNQDTRFHLDTIKIHQALYEDTINQSNVEKDQNICFQEGIIGGFKCLEKLNEQKHERVTRKLNVEVDL
ncbi:hypothetical protein HDU79_010153 [Rhizoclosmatium sp. JEL0117]|nr:hypothetical protein HDU79_010153 [Rhizoclosmatium sp. JEL0117]